MAFLPITSDRTTTIQPFTGDDIVILPGVSVTVEANAVLASDNSATNVTLTVLGTIAASVLPINFQVPPDDQPGNYEVYIGPTGNVISVSDFYVAIAFDGSGSKLFNAGYISGETVIDGDGFIGANTGTMENFDSTYVLNLRGLVGTSQFDNVGIMVSGERGIFLGSYGLVSFSNSGSVHGVTQVIQGSSGPQKIVNSGLLTTPGSTAIDLDNGDDRVINSGQIFGDVLLGGNADIYRGRGDGIVDGVVEGGSGNDSIGGGADDDWLSGGLDNDLIGGRGGDDLIEGGDGNDTLVGQRGEDTLEGGAGADLIRGGRGDDEIIAGLGPDTLRGGEGADVFIYRSVAEIDGPSSRDRILDFRPGEDRIDLSAIDADTTTPGDQAFTWIGTANYSGTRPELRYSPGNGFVQGDVDGDGVNDFKLVLANGALPSAGDFIL